MTTGGENPFMRSTPDNTAKPVRDSNVCMAFPGLPVLGCHCDFDPVWVAKIALTRANTAGLDLNKI